jgi:hypothetical protein
VQLVGSSRKKIEVTNSRPSLKTCAAIVIKRLSNTTAQIGAAAPPLMNADVARADSRSDAPFCVDAAVQPGKLPPSVDVEFIAVNSLGQPLANYSAYLAGERRGCAPDDVQGLASLGEQMFQALGARLMLENNPLCFQCLEKAKRKGSDPLPCVGETFDLVKFNARWSGVEPLSTPFEL